MNFYLHHHKSTEMLAIAAKTNDHFPSHMSNMDCSQVAVVNIWLLVPLISNQNCSFFLKSTCSRGILFCSYILIDFLKVIKWQFDTQFLRNLLVEVYKSIAVVVMAQYFFFVMYHSKCKKEIPHDLFSKDFSLL